MMIQLQQATLGYTGRPLLKEVNFHLPTGQTCCLLGANGSGKTTLLRTLLGLLPLLSGKLLLQGKSLSLWSRAELAATLAYVPQHHHGPFAFSVVEMVSMGFHHQIGWLRTPSRSQRRQAEDCLESLGIAHLAQRLFPTLSGGERQLVLIARALVQKPKIVIMDEPAASLDFGNQILLLETLQHLKQQRLTLLISTHHPLHARTIADNIALLDPNTGIVQGAPDTLLSHSSLAALYRVSPEMIRHHLGPMLASQNVSPPSRYLT